MGRHCVACHDLVWDDPYFQSASVTLFACQSCGSLTALPRPSAERQAALHDNAAYFEHPYFELRRHSVYAIERRCRATFAKIATAIDLSSLRGQAHLDVGCDTGDFLLSAARIWGTRPFGIDIARRSVTEAARRGVEAHCCTLEDAPEGLADLCIITAIDLIEHTVDPLGFMTEIKRRLTPGGVAYLETPNAASHIYAAGRILSLATGGRPTAVFQRLFPPEHTQYFSRRGLEMLATAAGYEIMSLETRVIPFADIGASMVLRLAATGVQLLDRIAGHSVLLCLVIRRPS